MCRSEFPVISFLFKCACFFDHQESKGDYFRDPKLVSSRKNFCGKGRASKQRSVLADKFELRDFTNDILFSKMLANRVLAPVEARAA